VAGGALLFENGGAVCPLRRRWSGDNRLRIQRSNGNRFLLADRTRGEIHQVLFSIALQDQRRIGPFDKLHTQRCRKRRRRFGRSARAFFSKQHT
jgi:hypothetical protein